jgi:hypothetical protein
MPQYLKEHGERLVELGYRIVPLPPGSKGPKRRGWPQMHADAAQVRQWYSNGSANDGIGVLARYTPAIDVDILDPQAAQEMSDLIDDIFPGETLMMRVGRAPKFLIPFRSDDPFKKLTSNVYTDGTNDHKVEILGDGQQWVAYHVHPIVGSMESLKQELAKFGRIYFPDSRETMLSALLTHSRYLREEWLQRAVGQRRAKLQQEMIALHQEMTTRSQNTQSQ